MSYSNIQNDINLLLVTRGLEKLQSRFKILVNYSRANPVDKKIFVILKKNLKNKNISPAQNEDIFNNYFLEYDLDKLHKREKTRLRVKKHRHKLTEKGLKSILITLDVETLEKALTLKNELSMSHSELYEELLKKYL